MVNQNKFSVWVDGCRKTVFAICEVFLFARFYSEIVIISISLSIIIQFCQLLYIRLNTSSVISAFCGTKTLIFVKHLRKDGPEQNLHKP